MKNELSNYIGYVSAWISYAGAILTKLGGLGDSIRNSFLDIKAPIKSDFFTIKPNAE